MSLIYKSPSDLDNLFWITTSEIEWEESPERYWHTHPAIVAIFEMPERLRSEDP